MVTGPGVRFVNTKCDVIVNGCPYWSAVMDSGYGEREVIVWFNVINDMIHQAPLPDHGTGNGTKLVDWKGDVALLALKEGNGVVDVWVLNDNVDGVDWWSKKWSLGPISGGLSCLVGCSRNGQIVGEDGEGNLILFDPETGGVDKFGVDGKTEHKFSVYNYTATFISLGTDDLFMRFGKWGLINHVPIMRRKRYS